MVNLRKPKNQSKFSEYLSKLSNEEFDYISETHSIIIKENPNTKVLLIDDTKALFLEKIERVWSEQMIARQINEVLI